MLPVLLVLGQTIRQTLLATAMPLALVRCIVVVAVSAVVVERLAVAWRLWLPVTPGRCRVVAGMVSALPPLVSSLLSVAPEVKPLVSSLLSVAPELKQRMVPPRSAGVVDLVWRLVAAWWQPWRLCGWQFLLVGKATTLPPGG